MSYSVFLKSYSRSVIILALIFTSGILYPLFWMFNESQSIYILFDIFLYPSSFLHSIPQWRFATDKDLLILFSNTYLAPVFVLISSLVWGIPISLISYFQVSKTRQIHWEKVLVYFSGFALLSVGLWSLLPQDVLFPDENKLPPWAIMVHIGLFVMNISELITDIPSGLLTFGTDSEEGYRNLYLTSRLNGGFGELTLGFIVAFIRNWISKRKASNQSSKAVL